MDSFLPTEQTLHSKHFLKIVLGIILGIVIVSIGILLLLHQLFAPPTQKQTTNTQILATKTPVIQGTLQQIEQDLNLITPTSSEEQTSTVHYFSAGIFESGMYTGYTRIIGTKVGTAGQPIVYQFASNDLQHFVFNADPATVSLTTLATTYPDINAQKISRIALLTTTLPQIIPLDQNAALYATNTIPTTYNANAGKLATGKLLTAFDLVQDFSSYISLPSPDNRFSFYAVKYQANPLTKNLTSLEQQDEQTKVLYLQTTTQVIVVDKTGLGGIYNVTNQDNISSYNQEEQQFVQALATYKSEEKAYESNNTLPFPKYPIAPLLPNLHFAGNDTNIAATVYTKYDAAFPQICGTDSNTYVLQNIGNADVQQVGLVNGTTIYKLTDQNSPLYILAFNNKINEIDTTTFQQVNNIAKPNYQEYVQKLPLLLFKDYFNRWVVEGEFDYDLPGGCGKPVMYFYPTHTTQIHVHFLNPMQLTTAIPNYDGGWNITAATNGTLIDNNPENTDCQIFNTPIAGQEYAKQACLNNSYPYLYWAGTNLAQVYHSPNSGWIVEKKNLIPFLTQKLNQIGLTDREKSDFLAYWIPQITAKNTPYIKISFLQTQEMNDFVPLSISPKPDSLYRIFLDYLPLESKPTQALQPEALDHIIRNGFTVIEWGGLKR